MRKLIYSMMVSLDGYVERTDHSLDWVIIDEELHQYVNDQQADIGGWLYGRGMYETMAAYWPTSQAEDPANPGYVIEFARIWKRMPKVVFSQTLGTVNWNSRLFRGDAAEEVVRLKAQDGLDLSVGGAHLAGALIQRSLVDVFELIVQPVALGSGTPYFPRLERSIDLELVRMYSFQSGVILLRYERKGSGGI
jgi:dihydrofolate reductase